MNYLTTRRDIDKIAKQCGRNPQEITLVAVSKGYSQPQLDRAYVAGCRDFGESRLSEAISKMEHYSPGVRWHLIGSLQKNKVRKAVEQKFSLIHSVDSYELAQKISQCSQEADLSTSILLQINISKESTKHGIDPNECYPICEKIALLPHLQIKGLMTMAPLTDNQEAIRYCFNRLRTLRDGLSKHWPNLVELSMGMSQDYPLAIQEGATLLRIGTAIFRCP